MRLDERGKQCPLPVIDTKKALEGCREGQVLEVLVDNEIAVQNLCKMAKHKGLKYSSEKLADREYLVKIEAGSGLSADGGQAGQTAAQLDMEADKSLEQEDICSPDSRKKGLVAVISSNQMGQGDQTLGKLLMKGFVYALTEQDVLPETVLLYNSGAYLSCEGSENLEDLKELEARGVEILTCGTCLNHYGLGEKLRVGNVTNMYEIVERMTAARFLARP